MSPSDTGKRSRGGCYTCRSRKVRCDISSPPPLSVDSSGAGPSRLRAPCATCKRLEFDCVWETPGPGEIFKPPPKKRKAPDRPKRTVALERTSMYYRPTTLPGDGTDDLEVRLSIVQECLNDPSRGNPVKVALGKDWAGLYTEDDGLDVPDRMEWSDALPYLLPACFVTESGPTQLPDMEDRPRRSPHWSRTVALLGQLDPSPADRIAILYYLDLMQDCAVQEGRQPASDSTYVSAFARTTDLPSLFDAILAYSSAMLSATSPTQAESSVEHAQLSLMALERDHGPAPFVSRNPEARLAAIVLLVKRSYYLAEPPKRIIRLLEMATAAMTTQDNDIMQETSGIVRSAMLWLMTIDCRASCFGQGGGGFTDALRGISSSIYGLLPVLQRAEWIRRKVSRLEMTETSSTAVSRAEYFVLLGEAEEEVQGLKLDFDSLGADQPIPPDTRNRYCAGAVLYSAILQLEYVMSKSPTHRAGNVKRALPEEIVDSAVQGVLRLVLALSSSADWNIGVSAWSSSLLLAGVTARDPIHQDWVMKQLQAHEGQHPRVQKTREVFAVYLDSTEKKGLEDIPIVMRDVTGCFLF